MKTKPVNKTKSRTIYEGLDILDFDYTPNARKDSGYVSSMWVDVSVKQILSVLASALEILPNQVFTATEMCQWLKQAYGIEISAKSLGCHLRELKVPNMGKKNNRTTYRADKIIEEYLKNPKQHMPKHLLEQLHKEIGDE